MGRDHYISSMSRQALDSNAQHTKRVLLTQLDVSGWTRRHIGKAKAGLILSSNFEDHSTQLNDVALNEHTAQ